MKVKKKNKTQDKNKNKVIDKPIVFISKYNCELVSELEAHRGTRE